MTAKILRGILDPVLVNRIPLGAGSRSGDNFGINSEAWVWVFLRASLATLGSADDANAVVTCVQASYVAYPAPAERYPCTP